MDSNCSCQSNMNAVDTKAQCVVDRRDYKECGIDSSLLFFFLILVCIVCQSDCDISMETLLWFFLLLVVLYQQNYF